MKASQDAWPKGMKRTKQRESVLSVLESAEMPLSASDICSKIEQGGENAWLSTIYRILELLVSKGLVVKANIMDSDMAVYELKRPNHKHYAVCMNCHKIIPMENCPMDQFIPKLEDDQFQVTGHNLEIYGFCKDCSPKQ